MEYDRQKLDSNALFHFSDYDINTPMIFIRRMFVISVCMLSLVSLTSGDDPHTRSFYSCSATTLMYKWDRSEFPSNLNDLFSALNSKATIETGYYNATFGKKLTEMAHGYFLCRGDVEVDVCAKCVNAAILSAVRSCPTSKRVVRWYGQNCMVRYSDESFFSIVQYWPDFNDWGVAIQSVPQVNATISDEPTGFNQVMGSILYDLVTEASKASSKFAIKEAHVTGSNITLYSLAQCTQDLSTADCNSCLRVAVAQVVSANRGINGGLFLCPSCNVRYETVPFYGKPRVHHLRPPPPPPPQGRRKPLSVIVASIVASVTVCAVLVVIGYYFPGRTRSSRNKHKVQGEEKNARNDIAAVESLQLDLETIETATNKFSDSNKLGQGGFGEVFKGTIGVNGQEIAVKRLSKSSVQGIQELKNEVLLIAKLQHRNLVKLLGFCLEGAETILIYEYVPNKSLDYFLNESKKREQLDWSRRCMIIGGIARGILYLHEDSRLRVIHRDLKPSNILLDVNMNPKISDFGMARMFRVDDQIEGNTRRIVGTYGYMAPEYAMGGFYSIKSDVFSFGVLLLEIVTGRRNFLGFHLTDTAATLVVHAWQLWNEGKVLELMDPLLKDSGSADEFSRYIHIGLLCVQQDANHRPTMSSVALMLKTETISLSKPEQPAFFAGRSTAHRNQSSAHSWSANGLTISEDVPR